MWMLLKTAWMALSAIKNFKVYALVGLVVALLCGGAYAVYHSQLKTISLQAGTIQAVGDKLGEVHQANELLQHSLDSAREGRNEAESKYIDLNNENLANAKKLEEAQRENEDLRKKMRDAQKNDPGANGRIPDDVKRMHQQAIREFNEKYGSGRGTTQAGDPSCADVRHSKGLSC